MDLTRIDTIVQFTQGSATTWNNVNVPVPVGVVVIDTVNKIMKEGDGVTLFANLPVCFDYNFSGNTSGAVRPTGDETGCIAIADDQMYSPSVLKLTDILTDLSVKATKATTQQNTINSLNGQIKTVDVSQGANGTIVICNNGLYVPGDKTLAQMISDLIEQSSVMYSGMHIADLEWYSDSGLTQKVNSQNELRENSVYWCKISGFHDTAELRSVDFGLANANNGITITNTTNEESCGIIAAVYGGTGNDVFYGVSIDSQNNIICVGYTASEGAGSDDALIVKFDSSLNILVKKRYGGTASDWLVKSVIDSNDNIFVVGSVNSEGLGNGDALIVKFDNNLNILVHKRYGGTAADIFSSVAVDSQNNVICVGSTASEGSGNYDALVVKFDNNLNILARKRYGGASTDEFFGVAVDSNNNIICVGQVASETTMHDALVIKFDTNLNILVRKRYGGTSASNSDVFKDVAIDSSNNIVCVGSTNSEGQGNYDAFVVKFDNSLNILAKKRYGGAGTDHFKSIAIDKNDNIICVGNTNSEGTGSNDTLILKFDSNLNIINKKRYGGAGDDIFQGINIDKFGDIICVGHTLSEGQGGTTFGDALIVKLPNDLPSGTITGTTLSGLIYNDSNLTLADSALTLANSTSTLADSTLTLANSTLTLANSSLTYEKDIIVAARKTPVTTLTTTVYASTNSDVFTDVTNDTAGNIIAVGTTVIAGVQRALIVKFTNTFTAIARKIFTGSYSEMFNAVVTDASNNIIVVGSYKTSSGSADESFIAKLDPTLSTILGQKSYGASGDDVFNDVVIDSSGNFIVVGYTTSEGAGSKDALIVKFDSNFNIVTRKRYGGSSNDVLNSVAIDTVGNTVCVGSTSSEGANTSGLLLKLDTSFNILARKIYNSTLGTATELNAIVISATNMIYIAGRVVIAAGNKGLVVKLDSNLNVTVQKVYGNTNGSTEFTGIGKDSSENITVVGKTNAEGAGSYDALVVKLTNVLTIIGRKTYGSVGTDAEIGCVIDSNGDIIMSGYSVIGGSTDAVITKLPASLPSGIYANKYFVDLILNDSKLTLSDDTANVSNSALTMANSTLVLVDNTMTLSNATGAIKSDTTILDGTPNIFKVQIDDVVTSGESISSTFNVVTNDGNTQVGKNIDVSVKRFGMMTAVYGGTNVDFYQSLVIDNDNNIYVVGHTLSEGLGGTTYGDALIVKYDQNMNILARKRYGGAYDDRFTKVVIGPDNNVYVCGFTSSEGTGAPAYQNALIVKFDPNLNILLRKGFGGAHHECFWDINFDKSGNLIACGFTYSEGGGTNIAKCLIVKFDTNLNAINKKYYGNSVATSDLGSVVIDDENNIIVTGYTEAEGLGNKEGLIIKFDNDLNIIARKRLGGSYEDHISGTIVDVDGNIYCAGYTKSEAAVSGAGTYYDGTIIKFDKNLNILAKKIFGGANSDALYEIAMNSKGDIIICGASYSEGAGAPTYATGIIVVMDKDLNVLKSKRYGGAVGESFHCITLDKFDNIVICGISYTEKAGGLYDALILKLPADIPFGTYTGTTFALTLTDTTTLAIDNLNVTVANSALTLANSALSTFDSTLTLANSALTERHESVGF